MLSIFPLPDIPVLETENEFWDSLRKNFDLFKENDILVMAHTPWSRIFGPKYNLHDIVPSEEANELARELDKDPRQIEVILRESNSIVKYGRKVLVTENKAGVVCANAGIDQSNAGIGKLIGVPHNPDKIAFEVRKFIKKEINLNIAVIVSDTVGRALRKGAVNIGIGVSGIEAMRSEIGKKDLFGYTMRVSEVAMIDEISSAAELVQGQTNEGTPFVIVRGLNYELKENTTAKILNRPENERIFK